MGGIGNIFGIGKQKGSDKGGKNKPKKEELALINEYVPLMEEEKYDISCRELEEELDKVNKDNKGFFLIPRTNYKRSNSFDKNTRLRQERNKNTKRSVSKDKADVIRS